MYFCALRTRTHNRDTSFVIRPRLHQSSTLREATRPIGDHHQQPSILTTLPSQARACFIAIVERSSATSQTDYRILWHSANEPMARFERAPECHTAIRRSKRRGAVLPEKYRIHRMITVTWFCSKLSFDRTRSTVMTKACPLLTLA